MRPGRKDVTVVSLYGLLDEKSDASVHRSLSELTPIFEDARYNKLLLLGGDLAVAGDFTHNSTFTPNNRVVIFQGNGTQNVSRPGGIAFDYIQLNKGGGSVSTPSCKFNQVCEPAR